MKEQSTLWSKRNKQQCNSKEWLQNMPDNTQHGLGNKGLFT